MSTFLSTGQGIKELQIIYPEMGGWMVRLIENKFGKDNLELKFATKIYQVLIFFHLIGTNWSLVRVLNCPISSTLINMIYCSFYHV